MASNLKIRPELNDEYVYPVNLRVIQGGTIESLSGSSALFASVLDEIREGHLVVTLQDECELQFGVKGSGLGAHWRVNHPKTFERLLHGGALALGESYMDGWWDAEDDRLTDLLGIMLRNKLESRIRYRPMLVLRLALHRFFNNPYFRTLARRAVRKHYDLSNEFYELMLDSTMTYSCGYQLRADDSLEQMQLQKFDLISRKLGLERGGRLIDIGCGWGGLLIYAATRYPDVSGVGITISKAQYEYANRRIEQLGLAHRVEVRLCDYREMKGKYDFMASVGMFEHVGRASYGEFMRSVDALLQPEGVGLLHTIGVVDHPAVKPNPWAETYVFPGGRLPRLEEIVTEMRRVEFSVGHVENLQPHYADTIRKWKENFDRHAGKIRALGPQFDDRFMRMWNYYLQSCEAAFRHGTTQVFQVLFCKGKHWARKQAAN